MRTFILSLLLSMGVHAQLPTQKTQMQAASTQHRSLASQPKQQQQYKQRESIKEFNRKSSTYIMMFALLLFILYKIKTE